MPKRPRGASEPECRTVAELVALLKREPGKYNFGSIGNGSLSHLAMERSRSRAAPSWSTCPYRVLARCDDGDHRGDVQMGCLPAISVTPHAASGQVKILAVSTAARSPHLPLIPTLKEGGVDVEADAWNGLIAPGRTPGAVVAKIQREVAAAIFTPEIRGKLAAQFMEPVGSSPEQFRAHIAAEIARWAPVIAAANIRIN